MNKTMNKTINFAIYNIFISACIIVICTDFSNYICTCTMASVKRNSCRCENWICQNRNSFAKFWYGKTIFQKPNIEFSLQLLWLDSDSFFPNGIRHIGLGIKSIFDKQYWRPLAWNNSFNLQILKYVYTNHIINNQFRKFRNFIYD